MILTAVLLGFPTLPTPVALLTPGKERIRTQMRKVASLSEGIRGIKAKLHLLRDETETAMDGSNSDSDYGPRLMTQYDAIGADLKSLTNEWEDGRASLASSIDKIGRRVSVPNPTKSRPLSPTASLGGDTAVGGSPRDALMALNGFSAIRSRSNTSASSSGEEILEAMAAPRQRSTLSREERIWKMNEERERRAAYKQKAESNAHMLKELETVIKLRPRGRTTGRVTSI